MFPRLSAIALLEDITPHTTIRLALVIFRLVPEQGELGTVTEVADPLATAPQPDVTRVNPELPVTTMFKVTGLPDTLSESVTFTCGL